jgi:hypothetical protein
MNPLVSCAILIATAQSLVAMVNTRDNLHLRPPLARKSVAGRLVTGLIVLRAYLRRLIIIMALELEWGLIDTRGPMKRPHGRKSTALARPSLTLLDTYKISPWLNGDGPAFKTPIKRDFHYSFDTPAPAPIDMAKLYAHLDYLAAIAVNPMAKAKRLAFHLARARQGIITAPKGPKRLAGRWGTQVRALYDAMAADILTKSHIRPPPLPPPRTHWPMITAL